MTTTYTANNIRESNDVCNLYNTEKYMIPENDKKEDIFIEIKKFRSIQKRINNIQSKTPGTREN